QTRIDGRLFGLDAVHRALHQVGHPQVPHAHAEPHQVGVHDLGGVVDGARSAREKELAFTALVLDLEPAFLDVDVRGAVLAHGAQLDDVGVTREIAHGEHQVVGYAQVV